MASIDITNDALTKAIKTAFNEAILENREFLVGMVAEAMEDVGPAEAIRQDLTSEPVSREAIMDILEGNR